LHYGLMLPGSTQVKARIDASGRLGDRSKLIHLFAFAAPEGIRTPAEAQEFLKRRYGERWVAHYLLDQATKVERRVRLLVWPILGEPVDAGDPQGDTLAARWIRNGLDAVDTAFELYQTGTVQPKPAWNICSVCKVRDICRR